ncbi:MAG TPA: hypothetical protein QF353_06365 [Gammaproteobacteria bacterium]|nr:hypothetical protein [Gammaproteobacteria bacterium]
MRHNKPSIENDKETINRLLGKYSRNKKKIILLTRKVKQTNKDTEKFQKDINHWNDFIHENIIPRVKKMPWQNHQQALLKQQQSKDEAIKLKATVFLKNYENLEQAEKQYEQASLRLGNQQQQLTVLQQIQDELQANTVKSLATLESLVPLEFDHFENWANPALGDQDRQLIQQATQPFLPSRVSFESYKIRDTALKISSEPATRLSEKIIDWGEYEPIMDENNNVVYLQKDNERYWVSNTNPFEYQHAPMDQEIPMNSIPILIQKKDHAILCIPIDPEDSTFTIQQKGLKVKTPKGITNKYSIDDSKPSKKGALCYAANRTIFTQQSKGQLDKRPCEDFKRNQVTIEGVSFHTKVLDIMDDLTALVNNLSTQENREKLNSLGDKINSYGILNDVAMIAIDHKNYNALAFLISQGLNIEEKIIIGENNLSIIEHLAEKAPQKAIAIATFLEFRNQSQKGKLDQMIKNSIQGGTLGSKIKALRGLPEIGEFKDLTHNIKEAVKGKSKLHTLSEELDFKIEDIGTYNEKIEQLSEKISELDQTDKDSYLALMTKVKILELISKGLFERYKTKHKDVKQDLQRLKSLPPTDNFESIVHSLEESLQKEIPQLKSSQEAMNNPYEESLALFCKKNNLNKNFVSLLQQECNQAQSFLAPISTYLYSKGLFPQTITNVNISAHPNQKDTLRLTSTYHQLPMEMVPENMEFELLISKNGTKIIKKFEMAGDYIEMLFEEVTALNSAYQQNNNPINSETLTQALRQKGLLEKDETIELETMVEELDMDKNGVITPVNRTLRTHIPELYTSTEPKLSSLTQTAQNIVRKKLLRRPSSRRPSITQTAPLKRRN